MAITGGIALRGFGVETGSAPCQSNLLGRGGGRNREYEAPSLISLPVIIDFSGFRPHEVLSTTYRC